jgi:small subunit ribosomal protein S6e
MAKFKMIVSDPQTAKAAVAELEGSRAQALIGRSIGEVIDGSQMGFAGQRLKITGGCDRDGIPMRADIHGGAKKYVVLSGGVGLRPKRHGERRRKLVRGRMITDETYQINTVVFTGEAKAPEAPPVKEPEAKPTPPPVKKEAPAEKKAKPHKKPGKKVPKKKGR